MKILILSARPETASNRRLLDAAAEKGLDCRIGNAIELAACTPSELVGAGGLADELTADAVLARVGNWRPESALALLEVITARGVPTPNTADAIRVGRDHWRTVRALAAAGLPVPETLAGADPEALASAAGHRLRFPVVVKQRRSRMGVGVIRCTSSDHLEAVLDSLWRVGDEVIVQRYHETSGRSLRVLVASDRVVAAAVLSAPAGEWRSNAARGGTATGWQPDDVATELAVAAPAQRAPTTST